MNSINLVSNGQGLDFIGTGVDTLNDNYEKVHAHFYCGIIGSDNNYQVLHHFCVDSTTHGYIANSITGDMDLTCGVGQTIVTSASIPSGLKSASNVLVTPWLTNVDAGGAVDANDAGCASVQAFTNAATYILDINSPQWQIVVPYPSVWEQ